MAYFPGHFARITLRRSKALAPVLALALLTATVGCAGLPSLNPDIAPDIAVEPVTPAPSVPKELTAGPEAIPGDSSIVSVDRIAYIGPYGELFTVRPDGSDGRQLTGATQVSLPSGDPAAPVAGASVHQAQDLDFSESFAWPTWSPDGTRLAVSRVQITPTRHLVVSVQLIDTVTGANRTIYENDVPSLVAAGAPHYLYWAPNSQRLAFLASTRQGLTLFVFDPDTTEGAIALERGAPLYFSWAGDGQALLVHSRDSVKLFEPPFDADRALSLVSSGGFRTPAFSPDGAQWAYSVGDDSGAAIRVTRRNDPGAYQNILETGPMVAFMWSPDSRTLAVADNPYPERTVYQRLRLVSADGSSVRTLVNEPLIAFYWSPNGERMAWVGVDTDARVFEWHVIPVRESGSPEDTSPAPFRFRPSNEVFTMLTFFDQYAYSHSPWSPDGSRLVIAGSEGLVDERRNGHTPSGTQIYVLNAAGNTPPTELAQGSVAFWSWN